MRARYLSERAAPQQSSNLLAAQDVRQRPRNLRPRDPSDHLGTFQRYAEQKLQRRDVHVMRRRSHAALLHQVQEILADLRLAELLRRSPVVRDEVSSTKQVVLAGRLRETLQLQILFPIR